MIINDLPKIMLICLLCTIIIEVVVALILRINNKKDILNVILVNIVTNPLVTSIPTFLYISYGSLYRKISLLILEILTFIFEGFIYNKYLTGKKFNGYIISLILNLSSYLIGLVLGRIIF